MNRIVPVSLVVFLTLVFTAISGVGICLTCASVNSAPAEKSPSSEVTVEAKGDGVKIDVKTMIPGIIVFVFGAAGLVLMLVKIPVKRILSVEYPQGPPAGTAAMMTMDLMTPRIRLAEQSERLPLLLWLLIRNRGIARRVKNRSQDDA